MADILGFDTGVAMPKFAASSFGTTLTYISIFVLVTLAIGIVAFLYLSNKKFSKKLIFFENIAGQGFQVVGKDRAMLVKIGDGGEEILYLRKKKVFRTAYGKKMGKNTYWFARGQDGYDYNVTLGDLDAKMGMLDIEPIDRDMRYMHVAIRKNITERYRKIGFMEKYGMVMIGGVFLLIMVGAVWLLIDNVSELISQATGVVEAAKQIIEPITQALSKVDSMCAGGTGISGA
jgi:hypothetical protein